MIGAELANFRDLGGLRTKDGREVAPKRLLRCGDMSELTGETIRSLQEEYHVVNVVDLRTAEERGKAPDCEVPGARAYVLDFFPGEKLMGRGQATGSREQLMNMQNAQLLHDYMKKLYGEFITTRTARDAIRSFVQILLETEEGATVFHCFAGKDRTGISAAVILTILGVPRDTIMEDYMETNHMRATANQVILDGLRQKCASEEMLKAVETALSVDQDYLCTSFETAHREYGSFENYIETGLGIGQEEQKRLKELYLVRTCAL